VTLVLLACLQIFTGNLSYHYLLRWDRLSFVLNPAIVVLAFGAKPRRKQIVVQGESPDELQRDHNPTGFVGASHYVHAHGRRNTGGRGISEFYRKLVIAGENIKRHDKSLQALGRMLHWGEDLP